MCGSRVSVSWTSFAFRVLGEGGDIAMFSRDSFPWTLSYTVFGESGEEAYRVSSSPNSSGLYDDQNSGSFEIHVEKAGVQRGEQRWQI